MLVATATKPPPSVVVDSFTIAVFFTANFTFESEFIFVAFSEPGFVLSIFISDEVLNVVCIPAVLTEMKPPETSDATTSKMLVDEFLISQSFNPFSLFVIKSLIFNIELPVNLLVISGLLTEIIPPPPEDLLTYDSLVVLRSIFIDRASNLPPILAFVAAINSVLIVVEEPLANKLNPKSLKSAEVFAICVPLITALPITLFFPEIVRFIVLSSFDVALTAFTPTARSIFFALASATAEVLRFELTFNVPVVKSLEVKTVFDDALF